MTNKVLDLHKSYCQEGFDQKGVLNSFIINCPDDFNFSRDIVDEIARIEPDRRAMTWCNALGEERVFSFGEMKTLSDKAANVFLNHGIKKGDKVMLILKRHYQYWYAILGLHKIGAIAIPATNLLTTKDLIYRANAASVKGIISTTDGDICSYIDEAMPQCEGFDIKFSVKSKRDGWIDFDKEIEQASDILAETTVSAYDTMLLYFTSGTTGYPKMVTHDYTYPIAHIITAKYWQNIDPNGLHLTVSETGWAKAAWGKLYGQWFLGGGIFVYDFDKFAPLELLEKIEKYKITTFCAPPTIFRFFIKEGMDGYDLSSLQYVTIAGEALNLEVYNRFKEITGLQLMEGFGQTETTLTVANFVNSQIKPGSMGKPTPLYNISLVDEDGEEVAVNKVGEIVVTPDEKLQQFGIFGGYYRDPELTESVWAGGVYHTGDTAYRDEDGYFWYVGRTDDLIKSSGYRIGPFEIESVLMEHPAVLECAVTGEPDPVRGQIVKATIVLTSTHTPSDELAAEIQLYVKKSTAPYKYPRIIEFTNELPKTISGKIRRVELRKHNN